MKKIASNDFRTLCLRIGAATRPIAAAEVPSIYTAFDTFLQALEERPRDRERLEAECVALLARHANPLYDQNIKPSSMTSAGPGALMHGFQMIAALQHDLPVLSCPSTDARIRRFYSRMGFIARRCHQALAPILDAGTGMEGEYDIIVKVWRYRNSAAVHQHATYLVPPHFDRSVFSIMLDSRMDAAGLSKHLFLCPADDEPNIALRVAGLRLELCRFPERIDYPIVIAGAHASVLGGEPVLHGVTPMQPDHGRFRNSLLAFVVPKRGLHTVKPNMLLH